MGRLRPLFGLVAPPEGPMTDLATNVLYYGDNLGPFHRPMTELGD